MAPARNVGSIVIIASYGGLRVDRLAGRSARRRERHGRPKRRAIWPVQSRPIADSGVPKLGEPDCMSVFERNEPKITGQPGAHELRERDAGQRLGHLLRERRRDA